MLAPKPRPAQPLLRRQERRACRAFCPPRAPAPQPPVLVHGVDVGGSRFFSRPIVRQAAEFAAQAHRWAAAAGVVAVHLLPLRLPNPGCLLGAAARRCGPSAQAGHSCWGGCSARAVPQLTRPGCLPGGRRLPPWAQRACTPPEPAATRAAVPAPQRPGAQDAASVRDALHRDCADSGGAAVANRGRRAVRGRCLASWGAHGSECSAGRMLWAAPPRCHPRAACPPCPPTLPACHERLQGGGGGGGGAAARRAG